MRKRRFLQVVSVVLLVLLSVPLTISGSVKASGNIYDDFGTLELKPDGNWWIMNWGPGYIANEYCGPSTCVLQESDAGVDYARLIQYPNQLADTYYNAELAELQTGFGSGVPTQWTPTVNEPVVYETRLRFSENYEIDGTGGAIGSVGVWLWNSPIDLSVSELVPQDGIGFNWTPSTSGYVVGLNATVFDNSVPVFKHQIRNIDIQEWNTFKVVWSVNPAGIQHVQFYVNGVSVGGHGLVNPMSNMSVETWNDNQRIVTDETGFHIVFDQVQSDQYMDIDYISLSK